MSDLCRLIWCALIGLFRPRAALEAEILILRHQLNVLRRWVPSLLALEIATARWRPETPADIRQLIRDMSIANPLWGAPRIHGELLTLGIDVGQTTVAKYMARRRRPPSQGWKTFLRNHADGIASMDLFVVPTISFRLLYGFLILQHSRCKLLWLDVTARPSAHWIARQLTEAYGWQQTPRYIVRDRDCVHGKVVIQPLRVMGIPDRPISPRSPWQNGYSERLIGSIRRDCLDHVVVFGERHLRHLLNSYQKYYNEARTHLSLDKDAPTYRPDRRSSVGDASSGRTTPPIFSERNFRQGHQVRARLNGIARIQSQDTSQMLLAKIRTGPSSPAGASQSGAQHVDSARATLVISSGPASPSPGFDL